MRRELSAKREKSKSLIWRRRFHKDDTPLCLLYKKLQYSRKHQKNKYILGIPLLRLLVDQFTLVVQKTTKTNENDIFVLYFYIEVNKNIIID